MNIIAIDIGNTNITIGLFLAGKEQFIKFFPGQSETELADCLKSAWQKVPIAKSSKEKKHDGVIVVSSVKPAWTKRIQQLIKETLDERTYVLGKNLPLPMKTAVDEPAKVGTDRIASAVAAYDVVEGPVVVADFGTAVTIDLVDDKGVFLGGVICPGFDISAEALKENTAQLPKIKISRPKLPYGKNTTQAINCGLYYSAIGTLREVVERYAEQIGKWPYTIVTGAAADIIKNDCDFIDSFVPNLVVKGIVLAYQKYIEAKTEQV